MNKMSLNEQAQEILRIANEYGAENNFFFITTFKRYQVLLKTLNDLEKSLNDNGSMVTKEYVKGRKNLYTNPAIKDYNNTKFAVIRRNCDVCGLFSFYITNLGFIHKFLLEGYIPVIDLK